MGCCEESWLSISWRDLTQLREIVSSDSMFIYIYFSNCSIWLRMTILVLFIIVSFHGYFFFKNYLDDCKVFLTYFDKVCFLASKLYNCSIFKLSFNVHIVKCHILNFGQEYFFQVCQFIHYFLYHEEKM